MTGFHIRLCIANSRIDLGPFRMETWPDEAIDSSADNLVENRVTVLKFVAFPSLPGSPHRPAELAPVGKVRSTRLKTSRTIKVPFMPHRQQVSRHNHRLFRVARSLRISNK